MGKRYDVACVGLQVIDILVKPVDLKGPAREVTVVDSVKMLLGGDALNQAAAAGKLGAKTALLGAVGSDRLGDTLLAQLRQFPIDVYDSRLDCPTTISVVLIDGESGERRFLYQAGQNDLLDWDCLDEAVIRDAKVVSVGGALALRALDGDGLIRLLETAKEAGAITAMDFRVSRDEYDMDKVRRAIALTDYLLPSRSEASWLTGESEDPVRMAAVLRDMGGKNVVVKLGDKGSYVSAPGVETHVAPCPCRQCVDATGAGDAFAGAFAFALSRGWDILRCARFAGAAGSITVEYEGANLAPLSEAAVLTRMN